VFQIQDHEIEAGVTYDLDESGVGGLGKSPHHRSLRERPPEALDGVHPDRFPAHLTTLSKLKRCFIISVPVAPVKKIQNIVSFR
jgi:hypothetical protein